jgi:hypothetical protein
MTDTGSVAEAIAPNVTASKKVIGKNKRQKPYKMAAIKNAETIVPINASDTIVQKFLKKMRWSTENPACALASDSTNIEKTPQHENQEKDDERLPQR